MRKSVALIRAFVKDEVLIEFVGKMPVSKTPGEVTDVGHN